MKKLLCAFLLLSLSACSSGNTDSTFDENEVVESTVDKDYADKEIEEQTPEEQAEEIEAAVTEDPAPIVEEELEAE